jgi:L-threonylcarbamoyladenylate synthase
MKAFVGKDVAQAADYLKQGYTVGVPTETVYGLAANALDLIAVAKIFSIKERPFFDPLIVHCRSIEQIADYVIHIPDWSKKLAEFLWPGPLTILLNRNSRIPDIVTAALPKAGFRIPNHPLMLELLWSINFPIAAPSANPFGYISPTKAEHVLAQLGEKIPYVLDGGACRVGLESTIIGEENGILHVYRKGAVQETRIAELTGLPVQLSVNPVTQSTPMAAGMLNQHYAPHKPLFWGNIADYLQQAVPDETAVISFTTNYNEVAKENLFVLSPAGNLEEAASKLFAVMRQLDERSDIKLILAERFPEEGIGRAINDRLKKASSRRSAS